MKTAHRCLQDGKGCCVLAPLRTSGTGLLLQQLGVVDQGGLSPQGCSSERRSMQASTQASTQTPCQRRLPCSALSRACAASCTPFRQYGCMREVRQCARLERLWCSCPAAGRHLCNSCPQDKKQQVVLRFGLHSTHSLLPRSRVQACHEEAAQRQQASCCHCGEGREVKHAKGTWRRPLGLEQRPCCISDDAGLAVPIPTQVFSWSDGLSGT